MFLKKLLFRQFYWVAWASLSIIAVWLAGCATSAVVPAPTDTLLPTRDGNLVPFPTLTSTLTPTPVDPSTPTPPPSPTPTPRTHTVASGDDLLSLAWKYGVSLEALKAANPTVQPSLLSIGTVLVIPPAEAPPPETEATAEASVPTAITPVPLEMGAVTCSRSREGGAWCFQLVRNQQSTPLESVSALFRLTDQQTGEIREQTTSLLLDVLPPDVSLPLVAYFAPPLPDMYQASSDLLVALPSPSDGRYLPVQVQNQQVFMEASGLAARVNLEVMLDGDSGDATRVWVVAVAYDPQGNVAGVRRWENNSAGPLQSGQALPVTMQIYSVGGPIERVVVLTEARP